MHADRPELLDRELTDLDRQILEFERDWVSHAGAKDAVLRDRFDTSTRELAQQADRQILALYEEAG